MMFSIEIDTERDCIRLYGTLYSLSLFRDLGSSGLAVGEVFKIVERTEDKGLGLQRLTMPAGADDKVH